MEQHEKSSHEAKTSTGQPIGQAYTPPVAQSYRPANAVRPKLNVFADIFPEQSKSKRPSSTTINKPQSEVFARLRNVENFPMFFEHLAKVEIFGETQTLWHFKDDETLAVPMRLHKSQGEDLMVWKTEDAAGFDYTLAISLEKAQADRGTVARIMAVYDSKAGKIASIVEKIFGKDAEIMAKKSLQRFKAYCETGHVPTTEGQPSGRDEDSYIIKPSPETQTLKH